MSRAGFATGAISSDHGGIIAGWLIKIVVGLALFGLAAFDAVAIGVAHIGVIDDADTAARAASSAWHDSQGTPHARDLAYEAAKSVASRHGETIEPDSFTIAENGAVHLTLRRVASTMVIRHIAPLRRFSIAEADGSAPAPVS